MLQSIWYSFTLQTPTRVQSSDDRTCSIFRRQNVFNLQTPTRVQSSDGRTCSIFRRQPQFNLQTPTRVQSSDAITAKYEMCLLSGDSTLSVITADTTLGCYLAKSAHCTMIYEPGIAFKNKQTKTTKN